MKKVTESHSFYFASKSKHSRYYTCDDNDYKYFLRHGDVYYYLEQRPAGSRPEDFDSRPLFSSSHHDRDADDSSTPLLLTDSILELPVNVNMPTAFSLEANPLIGTRIVERKVPCKVGPKAIFAAERTFFTWIRSSLFLFGGSLTVLKYCKNEPVKMIYGCFLLSVSLVFIVYPLIRYRSRIHMLTRKAPGSYYDTVGPVILCLLVMVVIVSLFLLRLSHFW